MEWRVALETLPRKYLTKAVIGDDRVVIILRSTVKHCLPHCFGVGGQ